MTTIKNKKKVIFVIIHNFLHLMINIITVLRYQTLYFLLKITLSFIKPIYRLFLEKSEVKVKIKSLIKKYNIN